MAETRWHGTDEERDELLKSLDRNCECKFDAAGVRSKTCPGHEDLLLNQRFLDGLLSMRHSADKLKTEEGTPPP